MKKIFIFAAAIFALGSCQSLKEEFQPVFTGEYDDPAAEQPVSMEATHTIAELAARYTPGRPWTIDENIVISGIVSTTDRYGNFYKSFYIQDETGGMEIKLGKNGLYNDYLPGQRIYIDCRDLELGMYGLDSSSELGMVQLGYNDPSGSYETSYLESSLLIDTHVFKGEVEGEVEPIVLDVSDLPGSDDTQATNPYLGKLVTIRNLSYGYIDYTYDKAGELNEAFALLYIDSNKDKKASSNRIFISGADTGITTWAMSCRKKKWTYICSREYGMMSRSATPMTTTTALSVTTRTESTPFRARATTASTGRHIPSASISRPSPVETEPACRSARAGIAALRIRRYVPKCLQAR